MSILSLSGHTIVVVGLKTTLRKRLAGILRRVEVLDLYRCRLESVFQVNAVGDLDCRVEKRWGANQQLRAPIFTFKQGL